MWTGSPALGLLMAFFTSLGGGAVATTTHLSFPFTFLEKSCEEKRPIKKKRRGGEPSVSISEGDKATVLD